MHEGGIWVKDVFLNIEQQIENIDAKLEDIVKNAMDAKNYEKLNQKINDMVSHSTTVFEQGYEKAEKVVKAQSDKVKTSYEKQQESIKQHAESLKKSHTELDRYPVKRELFSKKDGIYNGGLAMAIVGFIFAGLMGLGMLAMLFLSAVTFHSSGFWIVINQFILSPLFVVFLITAISGCLMIARVNRFKKYKLALGGKLYANVSDLAISVNKSKDFVQKDLQKMIRANWFKQGRLTPDRQVLTVYHEVYEAYQVEQEHKLEIERLQEENRRIHEQLPLQARTIIQEGEAFMEEIHEKKVAISEYDMTIKLSNLERLLEQLFNRIQKHPEAVLQLRKMMTYYLPTTVKLLEAYVQLDKQATQGTNIVAAKTEIETSLDTLILAYERLLDDLFKDVMLDVSTDIAVLNTMLAQDGLTGNDFEDMSKRGEA